MKIKYMMAALLTVLIAGTGITAPAADTHGAPDKLDIMAPGTIGMMQVHSPYQ